MKYDKLFTLSALILMGLTFLRWANRGHIPTQAQLERCTGQWPWATAVMLLLGIWGIARALRK